MRTGTGRLSSPGEHAARARVEAVYAAVDRLSSSDVNEMPAPRIDVEDRDARMGELERIADRAARLDLLDDARDTLSNALLARFGDVIPYPYSLNPTGAARVEDQAAIVTALRDLVAVAVMLDRLEPDDARVLARPGLHLLGSRGRILEDPAWAELAGPVEHASSAPPPGAPLEEDWAAADSAARRAADARTAGYSPPGTRLMRRGFFAVVAVAGVLGAVAWGLSEDSLLVGLLIAGAVMALCWTFATWSPRRG